MDTKVIRESDKEVVRNRGGEGGRDHGEGVVMGYVAVVVVAMACVVKGWNLPILL